MKLFTSLGLAAAILSVGSVQAEDAAPVQFSSVNHFNAPAVEEVKGVRFSALYGQTKDVTGVDFTMLAISEVDNLKGVHFPLLIAGASHVNGNMTGASFGLWNYHKGNDVGANIATVNVTNNVKGANLGLVNYSEGYTVFDWSAANFSKKSNVQLGIFNMTDEIKGAQIGLINCAKNGFLPCFPFVNFAVK